MELLLEVIPKHMDDTDTELTFLDDLLPWSPIVRETCAKPLKSK